MLEGRLVVFVSTETFLSTGNKHKETGELVELATAKLLHTVWRSNAED